VNVTITMITGGLWDCRSAWNQTVIDVCKSWGGRWQPDQRVWRLPNEAAAAAVAEELTRAGFNVRTLAQSRKKQAPPPPPPPPPRDNSWARRGAGDQVLIDLLIDLGLPAFRALTKVTHPDAGGSTEWSQRVNAAWTQAQKRGRSA
jgi:hypothetical protein